MKIKDPDFHQKIQTIFKQAPFIADLGMELDEIEAGSCKTSLIVKNKHHQHNGFIHAGVQTTMADHTAGAAAATLIEAHQTVLSVEYKTNLLRPARGHALRCQARVLKAGKTLSVVEAEVFCTGEDREVLVSKTTVTLAIVPIPKP